MVGNKYLEKGDLQSAQKYYGEALASVTVPVFAVANANMAWIDAQQNTNLDVALSMAQKAKSLMPEIPSITDTLAWVLYKKGNYAGAIPLLEDCVRKTPDSAEFHYHLGMALLASGEKVEGKRPNRRGAADEACATMTRSKPVRRSRRRTKHLPHGPLRGHILFCI